MRILHMIQPPRGGAVVVMLLLARDQVARHEVGVVCHPTGEAAESAEAFGASVWTVPASRSVRPREDLRHILRLRQIIREFRPDVIHAHSSKAGVLGRLAARAEGIPAVFSPHNFAYRAYEGSAAARAGFYLVERALVPWTNCLHVVSVDEYENAILHGMASTSTCGMIQNGVDLEPLLALEAPSGREPPVIGTLARLFEQKRVDLLIDVFAELRRRGVPFRGLIIGRGPLSGELQQRAGGLDLDDVVEFDSTPHDAPSALARIDIFALTSSHEACPLALMEAMAAARPVVATRVGGIPEIVSDTHSGLLVPFGDPARFADALQLLLEDIPLRRSLASSGREKARRRFGVESMAARMEPLYAAARRQCTNLENSLIEVS